MVDIRAGQLEGLCLSCIQAGENVRIEGSGDVSSKSFRSFGALALLAVLAGCTSTSDGGGLGAALRGQSAEQAAAPAIVQGSCPGITLREGTSFYRTFASGGDGDPSRVVHQASIAQTTRQCTLSGDEIVMNVTAAGRVAAGPAGGAGTVRMPIRVAAVRGGDVIYSELTNYSTEIPAGSAAGQFVFSDPNIRIPADAVDEIRVYVGFDEGPYDTP